jgi:hypothetical protein
MDERDEVMLTTFDNPFDPFDDFESWFMYDVGKGYYTCNLLGRITRLSDDMTEKEKEEAIERAIDDHIMYDPLNLYKKVKRKRE